MQARAVQTIIIFTFKDAIRARWLLVFALVFFLLALDLPTLFLVSVGFLPPNYLEVFLTTLVSVSFPLIPLLSLPMASTSIVDERETGTLQYVMSHPISRIEFLLARTFGLLLATTAVIASGFGVASVLAYNVHFSRYLSMVLVIIDAAALNAIMLGIALTISILSKRKATAIGIAIFAWFLFTVLSDIGFLAILINLRQGADSVIPVVLLNPIESSRLLAVLQLGGQATQLGSAGMILTHALGRNTYSVLLATVILWIFAFFALDLLLFRRRDVV